MPRSRAPVSYIGLDDSGDDLECSDYREFVEDRPGDDGLEVDSEDTGFDGDDNDDVIVDESALCEVDEQIRQFDQGTVPNASPDDGDTPDEDEDEEEELFEGNIRLVSYYRNANKTLNENDYIRRSML